MTASTATPQPRAVMTSAAASLTPGRRVSSEPRKPATTSNRASESSSIALLLQAAARMAPPAKGSRPGIHLEIQTERESQKEESVSPRIATRIASSARRWHATRDQGKSSGGRATASSGRKRTSATSGVKGARRGAGPLLTTPSQKENGRRPKAPPVDSRSEGRLGLRRLRPSEELSLGEDDIAVEIARLTAGGRTVGDAVLGEAGDRVLRARRAGRELPRVVPAVVGRSRLDVDRRQVSDQARAEARVVFRVEVVVDRIRLDRRTNRPHVGHRPLLLAAVDRVQQIRDRDGRDNPDDGNDDQKLDQGEAFLFPHFGCLLSAPW